MSAIALQDKMTFEEFVALPDDDLVREVVDGEVRILGDVMSRRNRRHCRTTQKLVRLLGTWFEKQPEPTGEILDGDVGIILARNPLLSYGIDVAYLSPALSAITEEDAAFIEGAPEVTIEVLSPSETQQNIQEKVTNLIRYGVKQVWLVEPFFKTVTIFRPVGQPAFYTTDDTIDCSPEMPGLQVAVVDVFRK